MEQIGANKEETFMSHLTFQLYFINNIRKNPHTLELTVYIILA